MCVAAVRLIAEGAGNFVVPAEAVPQHLVSVDDIVKVQPQPVPEQQHEQTVVAIEEAADQQASSAA